VWSPGSDIVPRVAIVRPADAGEVPALSAALAQAFASEALMNWLLPQRTRRAMYEHHPTEPHYYIRCVGVRPGLQGQGLGSALMRPTLERCDSDGVPAYLEASSERSAALYERLGFVHLGVLQLPDKGPPLWPMQRPPRD
jgi:ribosomal protein S18 acetylase RimI-like enzyme